MPEDPHLPDPKPDPIPEPKPDPLACPKNFPPENWAAFSDAQKRAYLRAIDNSRKITRGEK